MVQYTEKLAKALNIRGLINIQFFGDLPGLVQSGTGVVIESQNALQKFLESPLSVDILSGKFKITSLIVKSIYIGDSA